MSVPFSYQFDSIKDSLTEAAFANISASVVRLEKEVPSAARFARGIVYGSPIIDQVRARNGIDPEQIVAALVKEFHREFGPDPGRMPLQAIVFSATKP